MAGLTTTQSFSDGDTVTAAKLNNIISDCTIDADAVTTAKILDANVTLGKMATLSVDTGQLVDDAVQNSKLENMANQTVKANATTTGAANPTDVEIAANKLLVGTSDSLKGVTFTSDLELDAADDAATLIRAADTLISGKSTVTVVPANDTVLVYDADGSGNKLGKATVTDMMQTLPAVTTTSGVVRLATLVRSVAPNAAGIVDADVLTAKIAGPMLAKAWGVFTVTGSALVWTDVYENQTPDLEAHFNINTGTSAWSSAGVYTIKFTSNLPSKNYMVLGNGFSVNSTAGVSLVAEPSSIAVDGFTLKSFNYGHDATPNDAGFFFNFVVFGLTT